jgi:hypothetical protein
MASTALRAAKQLLRPTAMRQAGAWRLAVVVKADMVGLYRIGKQPN